MSCSLFRSPERVVEWFVFGMHKLILDRGISSYWGLGQEPRAAEGGAYCPQWSRHEDGKHGDGQHLSAATYVCHIWCRDLARRVQRLRGESRLQQR